MQIDLSPWGLPGPWQAVALTTGINNWTRRIECPAGSYILRVYKEGALPERIAYELAVLDALQREPLSFAVPSPLPAVNGERVVHLPGRGLATLVPVIPGTHPTWTNLEQVGAAGQALGELIAALGRIRVTKPDCVPSYGQLERNHPRFPDPVAGVRLLGVDDRLIRMVEDLTGIVPNLYRTLPTQVIHGDYVKVNLLAIDHRITGILDFEYACEEVRPFDLASGLAACGNGRWGTAEAWDAMERFVRGYVTRQALTEAEIEAVPNLIRLRRAAIFIHMSGKYLDGQHPEEVFRYGLASALEVERWLEANGPALVQRIHSWT